MTGTFNAEFLSAEELKSLGLKQVGTNVNIARNCMIVGAKNIEIGSNVRIDSFVSLVASEGFIRLGSFIHIGAYSYLGAAEGIILDDFSGLSQRVSIYTKSDDFSGRFLTNPTVPSVLTNAQGGLVHLHKHVIIGSGSTLMPKVEIGVGSAVGAMSLVTKPLKSWGIYFGVPVRLLKGRSCELLQLEQRLPLISPDNEHG